MSSSGHSLRSNRPEIYNGLDLGCMPVNRRRRFDGCRTDAEKGPNDCPCNLRCGCSPRFRTYAPLPRRASTLELGSFETAATLQIDNYPVLGPDGTRQTDDPDHIDRARAILEHATFVEWLDYDQYQKDQIGMCGGSFTGLTLYDATGKELVSVTYNPGYSDYAPMVRRSRCLTGGSRM